MNPEWLTAAGTIGAVLVALFAETFRRWYRRPVLRGRIEMRPPDCHLTPVVHDEVENFAYWFRIWVRNDGRSSAEQVQVQASGLLRRSENGRFEEIRQFLPMNLRWTHTAAIYAPRISPGMGLHCELGRIMRGQPDNFELLVEVQPFTGWHRLPPGVYRLVLALAAANADASPFAIEIEVRGGWAEREEEMFRDHIVIRPGAQ
jgi:hypothetical protein